MTCWRSARLPIDTSRRIPDPYIAWDMPLMGHGHFIDEVLVRYRGASSGSLRVPSPRDAQLLAIQKADELPVFWPQYRRDFKKWVLYRSLINAKKLRRATLDFLGFAWRVRSRVGLCESASNLRRMRSTNARWSQEQSEGGT